MSSNFLFKLFLFADQPLADELINRLEGMLNGQTQGDYRLEVVDIAEQPELAEQYNIMASPTLVRLSPEPVRKFVGMFEKDDPTGRMLLH